MPVNIHERIWSNDWSISLLVGVILLVTMTFNILQPLEEAIYDLNMRHINRTPSEQVAVIAIDDNSLAQLGEWPWSRHLYAQFVDLLAPSIKAMGITLEFSHLQNRSHQIYFDELLKFYTQSLSASPEQLVQFKSLAAEMKEVRSRYLRDQEKIKRFSEFLETTRLFTDLPETLTAFEERMRAAYLELDHDNELANSLARANKVVLGVPVQLATSSNVPASPLPEYLLRYGLKITHDRFDTRRKLPQPQMGTAATFPLQLFADHATVGVVALENNPRYLPLVIRYGTSYFPALPLSLIAQYHYLELTDLKISLGKGILLDTLRFNTNAQLQLQPFFYAPVHGKSPFIVDSFADVISGKIPVEKYRGKIVLLGLTTTRYSTLHSTPIGPLPSVLMVAHTLSSMLNEDFFIIPAWGLWLQSGLFLLAIGYVGWLLPRLSWSMALFITVGLLIGLLLLYFYLMKYQFSISLLLTFLFLPLGHLALWVKRGIIAYQDAFRLHPDAVESNRLLGLAFQGQGYLELAFEKFRLCPPDEAILGLLYNLALDYELKRQFRRAGTVYRYMMGYEPHFRDIQQRLERLPSLSRARWQPHPNNMLNDWLLDETGEKPLLGRYQIERLLGKGAMGMVYLGRDPKLDRLVAIKTLALSQEFEADELEEATTRFFREAAAAGRLTHPHIVAIYDAGEDQDLAYIAMEFFKGGNLVPYAKSDNLLAIAIVIEIVSTVAQALHYAHSQGVIHRDIKPANIMYNPATGKIKITDFGIAHITDSNKTKTGIILGTPSYMSPEQLAGKKVDGRADLFSLGVTLYQLLTGVLPFQADSMAALMFKIANESHPDIALVHAGLPSCLKFVVDKALQKNAKDRFQNGAEFAQALYDCLKNDIFIWVPNGDKVNLGET